MSYSIYYGPDRQDTGQQKKSWFGIVGAVLILTVCLLAFSWFLPQQARQFREAFLPWTRAEVRTAFAELKESIQQGHPIKESVSAFCLEIIHEADSTQ